MKKTEKSKKPSNRISKNISYKEGIYSATATRLKIENKPNEEQLKNMKQVAEKVFQPVREWCGHPIRINSFFRSEALNTAIRGSVSSAHMKGQAIDIDSLGEKSNAELFEYIRENCDFDQLIWEFGSDINPDWIHLSYVNKDKNRKEVLEARRERGKVKYYRI